MSFIDVKRYNMNGRRIDSDNKPTPRPKQKGFEIDEHETCTFNLGASLREIERIAVMATLEAKNYNRSHTAKALGICRANLLGKIDQYRSEGYEIPESHGGRPR